MGYRLHCATKYEVKYSTGDAFNYKCEEFHNLLTACGADWNNAIAKLKALETLNPDERSGIEEAIKEMEHGVEEIVSSMEYFLENADPNNDSLHLSYF